MLLGSLILSCFHLASLSRQNVPEEERNLFFLFVDEFHNFVPESFSLILGELDKKLREVIFGNVGTMVCFKVGIEDAEILEKEFYPEFKKEHLINLEKYGIYLKMAINGKTSKLFSARTLPPFFNSKS